MNSLSEEMRPVFLELSTFYETREFQLLLDELFAVPEDLRNDFVAEVVLSDDQLARRGVVMPIGLSLQRTQFADERPTLFAIVKHVEIGPWRKLTITVDNTGGSHQPVLHEALEWDELANAVALKPQPLPTEA